jgi:hypothetical protein
VKADRKKLNKREREKNLNDAVGDEPVERVQIALGTNPRFAEVHTHLPGNEVIFRETLITEISSKAKRERERERERENILFLSQRMLPTSTCAARPCYDCTRRVCGRP